MSEAGVAEAVERIAAEGTVSQLLAVACRELADLLDATRVSVSRVVGDLLVELSSYRRSGVETPLQLYLVGDYPLTHEVIVQQEARLVDRQDPDADPAEVALLDRLGHDSLLMLPLRSHRQRWGLVEAYADGRRFSPEEVERGELVAREIGSLLAELETWV